MRRGGALARSIWPFGHARMPWQFHLAGFSPTLCSVAVPDLAGQPAVLLASRTRDGRRPHDVFHKLTSFVALATLPAAFQGHSL
jgi:hypothetical protein